MERQPQLLLLLALVAAVCVPRVLAASYSLAWDSESLALGIVNTTTVRLSGVLQSDACGVPARQQGPCPAVAGVQVTVNLTGVGQLAVDSPPQVKGSSNPKKPNPPAQPGLRQAPVTTVTTTTDPSGAFAVIVSSSSEGDSYIVATATVDNSTLESPTANVWWSMPQATLKVEPEYYADTVGHNQTLTAELRLEPLMPQRSAPKQGKAAPKQDVATDSGFPPVPGALLTFLRYDGPFLAKGANPKPHQAAKPLRQGDYVEFANATTGEDGKAFVTLESPSAPGTTDIQVVYTDSNGQTITASTEGGINWYAPVPLPNITASAVSTDLSGASTVTVTLLGEDAVTPLTETTVYFDIVGAAIVDEEPAQKAARRAPSTRDSTVNRQTDAQGQASITLRSDTAGSSTVTGYYVDANDRRVTSPPITITWADPNATPNFSKIALRPRSQEIPVNGRPAELSALVLDASEAPVKDVTVKFTITPVIGPGGPPRPEQAAETTAAAEPAAGPATEKEAVSDDNGRAVITLESSEPGRFRVVASAENSLGQVVSSRGAFVRFFAAGDYPGGHHGDHHEHYPKGGHKDHGYEGRKHGRKHGNRRPGYAETDNVVDSNE